MKEASNVHVEAIGTDLFGGNKIGSTANATTGGRS